MNKTTKIILTLGLFVLPMAACSQNGTASHKHKWLDATYEWSDDNSTCTATRICEKNAKHIETEVVTANYVVVTAATCEGQGAGRYTATFTNTAFETQIKNITLDPTGHNYQFDSFVWNGYSAQAKYICANNEEHIQYHNATMSTQTTPATCTEAGNIKHTASYDGHSESKDEAIPETGHNYQFDSFVWNGYVAKAKYVCSHDAEHVIYHDAEMSQETITPATCAEEGTVKHTASYDGRTDTKLETIPATGHDYKFDSFVWVEYVAQAKYICSKDANHIIYHDATMSQDTITPATCTETGSVKHTASYDGHTEVKYQTTPAIGHDYKFDSFVWEGYVAQAKYICSHDETHVIYHDADMKYETTTPATCTDDGTATHTATYDGHSDMKYETLPSTGHSYIFKEFVWDSEFNAQAKYVCQHDAEHIVYYDAEVSSQKISDPTCEVDGQIKHTASYDGHTESQTEYVDKLGHNYGPAIYTWNEDNTKCSAKMVCQNDETHIISETVDTVYAVVTEPTEEEKGSATYTATFEDTRFETQVLEKELPATGTLSKLKFTLSDDGTHYLVGAIYDSIKGNVVVPQTYNDLPVTEVAPNGFSGCYSVTGMYLPEGIEKLNNNAFGGCDNIKVYEFPDSLWYFGFSVFGLKYSYADYREYAVYEGGYYIGDADNPYLFLYKFSGVSVNDRVIHPDCKFTYDNLWKDTSITSFTMPNNIIGFGYQNFYGCKSLTSITLSSNLRYIPDGAFEYCPFTTIDIPESVEMIGLSAFGSCPNITTVVIPSKVKVLPSGLFYYYKGNNLTNVTLPEGLEIIDDRAFAYCSKLEVLDIPSNVRVIGKSAFTNTGLINVVIPNGVENFSENVLENCKSLTSLTLPATITVIEDYSIYGCTSLNSITFEGTKEQWNKITFVPKYGSTSYWHYNVPAKQVMCSDGPVTLK